MSYCTGMQYDMGVIALQCDNTHDDLGVIALQCDNTWVLLHSSAITPMSSLIGN